MLADAHTYLGNLAIREMRIWADNMLFGNISVENKCLLAEIIFLVGAYFKYFKWLTYRKKMSPLPFSCHSEAMLSRDWIFYLVMSLTEIFSIFYFLIIAKRYILKQFTNNRATRSNMII